jgi:hypothetical protein
MSMAAVKSFMTFFPDCSRTVYQSSVTTKEFRVCDEKNFGMGELCSLDAVDVWPQIWGKQVVLVFQHFFLPYSPVVSIHIACVSLASLSGLQGQQYNCRVAVPKLLLKNTRLA